MTKEVLIAVKGLQLSPEDESDTVEIISPGEYYEKNGKHYLLFEEIMEGQSEVTKTVIKLAEDSVEVTRKGPVSVHMIFEKNKKNVTYYNTPVGSLQVGIDARKVDLHKTEELILAKVAYDLELNCEHVAQCDIQIKVSPKGGRDFHLVPESE